LNLPRLHNHLPRRSLLFLAAALILMSFFSSWYFQVQPSITYQQKRLQRYIAKEEEDGMKLLADSNLMRRLILQTNSLEEMNMLSAKDYGVFLFAETISDNQDLLFWNSQKILPPVADFGLMDGEYFQRLTNGYYTVVKKTLRYSGMNNRSVVAYLLIPVLNQYYLEKYIYLPTEFVHDKEAITKIGIAKSKTDYPINALSGKPLFYVSKVTHSALDVTDDITVILRLAALLFILLYLHLGAESFSRKRPVYGVVFLGVLLLLLRTMLYIFPGIFSFRQFPLFDPTIYATNWLNRSLGDLLINSILICWLVLFAWRNLGALKRLPRFLTGKRIYAAGVAALFFLIFATFQLANVVHGLVADSKISFNVTDFFSLTIFTAIGLIILALLSLSYFYFTRLLFHFIFPAFRNHFIYIYFIETLLGLVFLTFRSGDSIVLFHLPVLIWLVIYTLLVSQERFIINRFRATIAGVLFWIFVFSVSLAVIILQANREKEIRVRKAIAEKYDQTSDIDRTLSIAITYLDNRFLLNNFSRFRNPDENRILRDSILRSSFAPGYATRYDTRIYVFDPSGRGIYNDGPMTYPELNTISTVQSRATNVPDLYYHETSFDQFTYITRRIVADSSTALGSFFIVSTPKRFGNTDAFYPELFKQAKPNDIENSDIYSYAVYKDTLLISSSSKYPFPVTLTRSQIPRSEFEQHVNGGYEELWYKSSNKKVIVVAKKRESLIESITLFSYLFCAFLFMVGLIQIISLLLWIANEEGSRNIFSRFNIRSQIQGTIIFISVLLFVIIGIATISFFIVRYNRNNMDKLSRTGGVMVRELQKHLSDSSIFSPLISDSASRANMKKLIDEIADVQGVNVNVYDLQGNLMVTSEDIVYTRGVLSNKIHPLAFYHLDRLREVQHVQEEVLSSLTYLSIYSAVRNEQGKKLYYLNIPYFTSQLDLKQEISNFLVTIINLNAFIFLIAGVIALFLTNKITQSFSVIGEKMRAIRLGRTNEEIVWNKNDEIGELVKQYNKMVQQLEESAEALAKSEREGAWREMARQVAHEIKNPLTPMKLSIQYLQKAINSNHTNVKELTASVANTLIEQIDHLSKIAADFSQFANITNKKIEIVDLHQVIGSLVDLYSSNPKIDITWEKIPGTLVMKADKTQMNRVFTNLLANAVDACLQNDACTLKVSETLKDHLIMISISDNGEGIPEEMHTKIFMPNFTTKTSGTGLGLAMTKSIVEQAQGHIWFETEVGKGTTFFVELPVIE
jgi:two-component system nitrogen regulation sensor histidine kinase NtrY